MRKIIISLVKQFLFWLIVFAVARASFLVFYKNLLISEQIILSEVLKTFWFALPLDISTASYLLLLPLLILFFYSIFNKAWILTLNNIYTAIALLVYLLITTAEVGIYAEWKTKLHYKALNYLSNPDEVYNSASTSTFFTMLILLVVQFSVAYYLYLKFIGKGFILRSRHVLYSIVFLFVSGSMLFVGVRGGFREIPINQSQSYFSNHNILNLAAVNSGYGLLISTIENYKFKDTNPFEFYDQQKAEARVQRLFEVPKDTTIRILNTQRPNIVLILLESWSADVIESITGEKGITPNFHELEKGGILFTQLYATGNRSEQAIASIIAGFPSTPLASITHNLDKILQLPSLIKIMNGEGYQTSFYFGGQLIYGGIKSYLMANDFDRILEGKDFDDNVMRGKLGVHDEFVMERQLNELNKEIQPFFSILFTLSSHSPYDQPKEKMIDFAPNENDYLNSIHYTDKCLGEYFQKAKLQPWYENTLFVIVADHSHNSHKNWSVLSKEYRRIPLLIYGHVIKDSLKGKKISRIASQNDISKTLLHQLELDASEFIWSRDLFNPTIPEFAFFEATDGVGWISPGGYFVYHRTLDRYFDYDISAHPADSVVIDGKSYLQVLFQQFIDF